MLKKIAKLKNKQFSYYSNWYNLIIRELVTFNGFDGDYKCLAKSINPPITLKQAKESVNLLLELGLIKKTPSGRYVHYTGRFVTTGNEITERQKARLVKKCHRKYIELGKEAIKQIPRKKREISALAVGVSEKGFYSIKKEIQDFRRHIIDIADKDEDVDRVCLLNFQFFPVTKLKKKRA